MNSTGRIALVTGAGTGIGKRTALLLWEAGYSVVLAGRRVEQLEQTVQEAGVSTSRTLVMSTDVSDPQAVSALFAQLRTSLDGWMCYSTMQVWVRPQSRSKT